MEFSVVLLVWLLVLTWWVFVDWWYFFRLLTDIRWNFSVCKSSISWGLIVIPDLISLIGKNFYSFGLTTIAIDFLISCVFIIYSSFIPILPDISLKLLLWIIQSLLFRRIRTQTSGVDNNWIERTFIIIRMTYLINPCPDRINRCGLNLIWSWLNYLPYGIRLITCCVGIINLLRVSPFFWDILTDLMHSSP